MEYEPVIGLEVHAELATATKMFCACTVVDTTKSTPNISVCPVCAGLPGALPVLNRKAVDYGIRAALALECEVQPTSIFSRKNYFYPDLPKGYQISQYEDPLALAGRLVLDTSMGERTIRVRRVHLEEDTGKLTHVHEASGDCTLVDLNRAGVPLLEIVSEPDMHSLEEVRVYAMTLRAILRELGVNSGDMEKGVIRFEANVSLRPMGRKELGTRVEIKNLNSFRAMERGIAYELIRQAGILDRGERVILETLGWNEDEQKTYSQRSKEEAHDYRYFPEPDLPALVLECEWIASLKNALPELPRAKMHRLQSQYGLTLKEASLLASEKEMALFFEECVSWLKNPDSRSAASWITGELFAWLNLTGKGFSQIKVTPPTLAELIDLVHDGRINSNTGKNVLTEMLETGKKPQEIINARGLEQNSDDGSIAKMVSEVLEQYPNELASYFSGKETLANWFFGKAMKVSGGKANPGLLKKELENQLRQHQKPC
ncbi:MAG: Asp-tRNA(Asn)/Glu-tRNA(Gln) amidotransferase subunit GatB [Chloroflexi bacterium]|nr:Asp-tRNA(Asn)/Glu-tRNA(Gln) amidotransferase subunit GatB [Chloroflexota bacterium]